MEKYQQIFNGLKQFENTTRKTKMEKYMRNQFEFLGVYSPERKSYFSSIKPLLKNDKMDYTFCDIGWEYPFREAQYLVMDYLLHYQNILSFKDLNKLKEYIVTKSWWDTVDVLDGVVGELIKKDNNYKKIMLDWSTDENMWLRRTAINFQQKYKHETDKKLLECIILNNTGSNEFFINKAIGWSLREYAKTNVLWVKNFIESNRDSLSKLSVREAIKHFKNLM